MAKGKKSGLGRGLNALIGDAAEEIGTSTSQDIDETPASEGDDNESSQQENTADHLQEVGAAEAEERVPYVEEDDHVEIKGVIERAPRATDEVSIDRISPNPDQPRTQFKPDEIEELAASIEKEGLLQPIVVRRIADDSYQIVAGERRWQACKVVGLQTVPVRVISASDEKALELALIENIQRSDLNPIEEAYGYKRLMERRGMTQSDVAEVVSKGRSTIANALRLLELPEEAQQLLYEEKITAGHARAILSVPTTEGRAKLTERLAAERLSVRDTENLARLLSRGESSSTPQAPREQTPASYRKVAQELREKLQTNVRVKSSRGKQRIEIEFKDEEDLKRLFSQMVGE